MSPEKTPGDETPAPRPNPDDADNPPPDEPVEVAVEFLWSADGRPPYAMVGDGRLADIVEALVPADVSEPRPEKPAANARAEEAFAAWRTWGPPPDENQNRGSHNDRLAGSSVERVARLRLIKTHLAALRRKVAALPAADAPSAPPPSTAPSPSPNASDVPDAPPAAPDAPDAAAGKAKGRPGKGRHRSPAAPAGGGAGDPAAPVEEMLHYRFANPALLRQALTHSSHSQVRGADNERMEFFGDAVLDLVVREYLFHRFPERSEGDLTEIKSSVVRGGALAKAARRMGLAEHLRLGRGLGRGPGVPDSLLADAFEALVAAIYLDGGYGPARRFILREVARELAEGPTSASRDNYKSTLQQYVQQHLRAAPTYRLIAQEGPDHARVFNIAVEAGGNELGRGRGPNKKLAEQLAARAALLALGVISDPLPAAATAPDTSATAAPPDDKPRMKNLNPVIPPRTATFRGDG